MNAIRLLALSCALTACAGLTDEGGKGGGGKADDPNGGDDAPLLTPGVWEGDGTPGRDGTLHVFAGSVYNEGRFYAELVDYCFGPRCVQGLVACGTFGDGEEGTLAFDVSAFRTMDGDAEPSEDHRTHVEYAATRLEEGVLELREIIQDQRATTSGNDQVITRTGDTTLTIETLCPSDIKDPNQGLVP